MPEDLVVSTFRIGKTVHEFLTDQIESYYSNTENFNKSSLSTDNITPLLLLSTTTALT